MSTLLKEKIDVLSEAELAELSLRETLSVEEAICDVSDMAFLVETADLPVNPNSVKELGGVGDFDKYQFFNQDQIAGITNDDLADLYDPDNHGGHASEGDKDLNEAMIPGGPGQLNHDFVVRNSADSINSDLSVQFNDMPTSFDEILTGGNTLRRSVSTKHAEAAGVPIELDDLIAGKITASNVADEVNDKEGSAEENSIETTVDHPVGTHQNDTLKTADNLGETLNGPAYLSYLLGESADNAITDNNDLPTDDDGVEDDDDIDDEGCDDDEGGDLPDNFDEDDFLSSIDELASDDSTGDDSED
jgi:hypothetical protein